ncbi:MAG: tRNA pseudouridine(55) synthase TruB [Desulfobacterales bacterium]|nr:MAG: tRNA pseudouridine(55) synthase TruB [Desulfobacterales bacterium]
MNGILVIDKPTRITSAKVVAWVKELVDAKKAGHAGTLDPFATGVLVCCINRATKLSRFFLHGHKTYEAVLHLGIETDTQDATGTITSTCDKIDYSAETIRSVCKQFEGAIEQHPPVYSALKHKGIPLYKHARRGKPVQKPARPVQISTIDILEMALPLVRFVVSCSAGTYIRTLCADIGTSLGCGGHLKELRRIESSGFTIAEAITLSKLENLVSSGQLSNQMISMSDALRDMPHYVADDKLFEKIMYGSMIAKQDFTLNGVDSTNGFIKIVDANNDLVAVLESVKDSSHYKYCCVFNN